MTMTAPATASGTAWKLDPTHSLIEFSAKHMMITTVKGRFTDFEGTAAGNPESPAGATVNVTIKAASIDTHTDQRDGHLRSADFLDVEKFPTITFRSTKINGTKDKFTLTGDLTIRDVTKPITLDVTFEGQGADPWGGTRAGFNATGKIDRREFGLTWNQALETGGLLVSNDIKLQIDAQLIRG
jgi:polyisoprenoid-binding protein YceI